MPLHARVVWPINSINRSDEPLCAAIYNNEIHKFTGREHLRAGYVYDGADLYWEWGTSLWRRTSLDLMACTAHAAASVGTTVAAHADLEGAYR
jgi:hypothetical protein